MKLLKKDQKWLGIKDILKGEVISRSRSDDTIISVGDRSAECVEKYT